MNTTLGNKNLYKIFLICAKYSSYIYAFMQILGLLLCELKIITIIPSFIGGCSIFTIILLFLISHVFKFCFTHRIPLWYIVSVFLIGLIDNIFFIEPIFRIYLLNFGIFILLYITIWFKNKDNPKVDHIKQLCESYAECNCK